VIEHSVTARNGISVGRASKLTTLLVITACVVALSVLSVVIGTRNTSLDDVLDGVRGITDTIGSAAVNRRLPRTVLAIMAGAALAVSGTTMQAVTRNPLAEPGILGVSSGASLAVVLGIVFGGISSPYAYLLLAVVGATVSAVFVYSVGSLGRGGATPLKLALSGAAVSAAFSSLMTAILLPRLDAMVTFRFWHLGGVGGATWDRISIGLPFVAVGLVVCFTQTGAMNSLALGEELASSLGARVARARLICAGAAVLLCGVATSVAGPIAFVGLVTPHICRLLVGSDHRWLVPFTAAAGAALLLGADIVGRVIARPDELEVGIVTAVLGAPVLVWVASKQRLREL
jgi:iron complex transport system permease protein